MKQFYVSRGYNQKSFVPEKILMKYNMARKKKAQIPRLPLLLTFSAILIFFLTLTLLHKKEPAEEEHPEASVKELAESTPEEQPLPPVLTESKYSIEKGMTLANILNRHNLPTQEAYRIREGAKPVYDLAKIRTGQEIRIFATDEGIVQRLEYDIDSNSYLYLEKDGESYRAELREIPHEVELGFISGTLEANLISAVSLQNEQASLAIALSDLFSWDIDFYTDPRPGDTFSILFEKRYLGGKFAGYGKILAAEYINDGKKFQAFYFADPETKRGDHFDAAGNSLRREFLKSPIQYKRITSRFTYSRFHPLRKTFRPHYGVDYAASIGTPVQATADGTVTFAGWNGAAGYMIKIKHRNSYETMYLHLNPKMLVPGIRKGARIIQGQTIAYVGRSGEATGPHLDYRVKQRGRYINPLAKIFEPVAPIAKEYLDDFKEKVMFYSLLLEEPLFLFSLFPTSL